MTSSAETGYCPRCGLESTQGQTLCGRCGTDLAVISDILRGRYDRFAEIDDRLVGLLKDVYRGRRAVIAGALVSIISLGKLAPVLLFGLWDATVLTILLTPFLIAGLAALAWGLTKWNNASSEIKAIKQLAAEQIPSAAPRLGAHASRVRDPKLAPDVNQPHSHAITRDACAPGSEAERSTNSLDAGAPDQQESPAEERPVVPPQISRPRTLN
jgi:hypothetical protein